jgi:hypothetical protein
MTDYKIFAITSFSVRFLTGLGVQANANDPWTERLDQKLRWGNLEHIAIF